MRMRNTRSLTLKHLKKNADFLFVLPWILGVRCFTLLPYLFSFYISFTKYNMMGLPKWIGFENYIEIFTSDDLFWRSLWITCKYVFISVPMKLTFSLIIALILNSKLRFTAFYRTVFYIPSLLGSSVAIAVVWKTMFEKEGAVNSFLGIFGIDGPDWIGNPNTALFVLALLTMWQFGSPMLIFLAALKQVPSTIQEAAKVDGASGIRRFFCITLPMISPMIFFNLIMQMIQAFQTFTSAMMVTNGGPVNSTLLYVLMIYNKGFKDYNFGYASALSWVLLVIIMLFTAVTFKTQDKWVYYDS